MKNIENTSQKRQYGTLSMVAIIVGMVIGSGIFIKNQSLMDGTQSVILTTIGWVIGGLIVLSMMLAFIEISSITKIKGEQGTFKNWAKHLFSEKTSRYIGTYFSFVYFPLVLGAETIFASQKFMEIGGMDQSLSGSNSYIWLWVLISVISFIIISAAFVTNSFWVKPGKAFSSVGSITKLIPLFVIIIAGALAVFGLSNSTPNNIFDINDPVNSGLVDNSAGANISHILLILPGILFAFDGFLYANSMSNETKTPGTFKRAVIISVIFITLIYILFSVMSMVLAPSYVDAEGNLVFLYGIGDIIDSMFKSNVIGNILIFLIFLSITSATFGYAVTTMWSLADYSDTNYIVDTEGKLIRRNKVGNPSGAGMRMLIYTLIAIAIMRGFDLITLGILSTSVEGVDGQSSTIMTDYTSDLFTVTNFAVYSILIIGGLTNRSNKKNEVEKIKGFVFFGIFSSIMMIGVVGYMGYSIISSIFIPFFGEKSTFEEIVKSSIQLVIFISFISSIIIIEFILSKMIKKTSAENWGYKRIYRKAYELHIPYKEYKDNIPVSAKVDFSPAYKKLEEMSGVKINKSKLIIEETKKINTEKLSKNENLSLEELQDKIDKYYEEIIKKDSIKDKLK